MDVAWLEILRRHPEVAEDIPGAGGVARRNRNLDKECHPSCQTDKAKQVAVLGAGEGEFAYSINVEGMFQVLLNSTGKVLRSLQLFPLEHDTEEADKEGEEEPQSEKPQPPAPVRKDGSLVQLVEMSNTSVAESPDYMSRVAVLRIEANLPPPVPEEDPAAKKGKKQDKKAAAPSEEVQMLPFKCHITIVETCGRTENNFEARVLNNFECLLTDSNVQATLSQDGRVLTVSHGMTIDLFKLVPMTEIIDPFNAKAKLTIVAPTLMPTTDEDDEMLGGESPPAALPVIPPPLCRWDIREEITRQTDTHYTNSKNPNERQKHGDLLASLESSRVWRSFLFPFLPAMQWNDAKPSVRPPPPTTAAGGAGAAGGAKKGGKGAPATNAAVVDPLTLLPLASLPFNQQQKLARDFQNGLVVFLEDVKAFFVFGLRNMSDDEQVVYAEKQKLAMDAAILAAGGSVEEGGVGTSPGVVEGSSAIDPGSEEKESPLLNSNPPFLELITFWSLSAAVTAVDTDAYKSLLVCGQADGVVAMWDLRSLQMTDVPARHQSLVTSVALTNGSKAHSLVSGDTEGTLCFFNLAVPNSGGEGGHKSGSQVVAGGASFADTSAVQQCVKAELIDFRCVGAR
jgi:hypothetical protein